MHTYLRLELLAYNKDTYWVKTVITLRYAKLLWQFWGHIVQSSAKKQKVRSFLYKFLVWCYINQFYAARSSQNSSWRHMTSLNSGNMTWLQENDEIWGIMGKMDLKVLDISRIIWRAVKSHLRYINKWKLCWTGYLSSPIHNGRVLAEMTLNKSEYLYGTGISL